MKFFNQFIDPAFRKNEKGETFFFPWGNFGKAYPVKTEEEVKKLRIAMSVLTLAGCIGSVSMLLFFGGFAVLLFLIFAIFIFHITFKLMLKERPLKIPYTNTEMPSSVLIRLAFLSFLFVIGGIIFFKDDPLMGTMTIVFFGLTGSFNGWLAYKKWKMGKSK